MSDDKTTLKDIKNSINEELKKQQDSKADVKKAQDELRELRKAKRQVDADRADTTARIRKLQQELAEDREIAASKDSPDEVRAAARERISQSNIAIRGYRSADATSALNVAQKNIAIQGSLAKREQSENALSSSRSEVRDYGARQKAYETANNLTPSQLRGQLSKGLEPDAQLEGMRAANSIKNAGGTKSEQKATQGAELEFQGLFSSIKETKKALLELKAGTEEYSKKQNELIEAEGKASDALQRMEKISRDVEKRNLAGDGGAYKGSQAVGSAIGGAFKFGADAFDRMGGMANERYVMEEQRKNAQLGIKSTAMSEIANSTRDAGSYLATGGASRFGAESVYDRNGNLSKNVRGLGQDYADTQQALPGYKVGFNALSGAAALGTHAVGEGIKGAAINPLTGVLAGGGALLEGGANLALSTAKDVMLTPQLSGAFGGTAAAKGMKGLTHGMADMVDSGVGAIGDSLISKGGGDKALFAAGRSQTKGGAEAIADALPNVIIRANEAVSQMNQLVSAEQQAAQAARVKERSSAAFGASVQQYMDTQPTNLSTLRSRSMSAGQRNSAERGLENFSMDSELGERGFGVGEILSNTNQAARGMGRFGAGGMNEAIAKSGMMGESMGLGSAGQSISAMTAMSAGGVKDPAAMFEKAMREGLMKGLQDSRQFQELLSAAVDTSQGVGDLPGTLKGVLGAAGSGRANDVLTARASETKAEDRMSGHTGTWRDMVKVDINNKAMQGAIAAAGKKGVNLNRDDKTSLANLANVKPAMLENEDYLNSILTSGAKSAIQASGKTVKEYGSSLASNQRVHAATDGAINATQSPELAQLRNDLASGNKDAVKKRYANNPGKLKDLLALMGSGATAEGDTAAGIGDQQRMINMASDATGIDRKALGGMQGDYEGKTLEQAKADSANGGTAAEASGRANAKISQGQQSIATNALRGPNGESTFAQDMARKPADYFNKQSDVANDVKGMRTTGVDNKVVPIDKAVNEMVEGLKKMKDAFEKFSAKDLVMNVGKDVVIQGASAIKGVMLDNALTQAATEAGKTIANTVNHALHRDGGGAPSQSSGKSPMSKPVDKPLGG